MKYLSLKKMVIPVYVIFAVTLMGFSAEKMIQSDWTVQPINIDGLSQDWSDINLNLEKKTKVDYAFKNDGEYLYTLFKFNDPSVLSSIQMTGMRLWFNLEGKNKKIYGVRLLTKQITADEYIATIEKRKGPLPEKDKNDIRVNPFYVINKSEVINKKGEPVPQASGSENSSPIRFQVVTQENIVSYEMAVPLKRTTDLSPGIGTEPGNIIKVAFEWGGVTKEMREAWMKTRGAGGGGGGSPGKIAQGSEGKGGGASSSGAIRSQGIGSLAALNQRMKQYSFWVDVQLAQKTK